MAVFESVFKFNVPEATKINRFGRNLDPFWATRLWQHLVQHVMSDVKADRKRHLFKYYENVFDGTAVTNVVYSCLNNCVSAALPRPATRQNAIKVCQVLMDSKLFESMLPKSHSKFEDSVSRFYRFVYENSSELISTQEVNKENCGQINGLHFLASCRNRNSFAESSMKRHLAHEHTSIRLKSARRTSSPCTLNVDDGIYGIINLPRFRAHPTTAPDSLTEDMQQQLKDKALMYLLALVDIPILEGILCVSPSLSKVQPQQSNVTIRNTGNGTERIGLSSKYGNIGNIPWVAASAACLGRYPDGVESLWSLQSCKILCYQSVREHYAELPDAVIPDVFICICTAIIELLKSHRRLKALLITQLFMVVLPWQRRKQLRCLLEFLYLVIGDIFVIVDKKITNYEAVSRDFLDAIMKHPCVSRENFQYLFDFLVYKVHKIFEVPNCLILRSSQGLSFCKKISFYHCQRISCELTSSSLKNLSDFVMDSTALKLAEKKTWMKKLRKFHPEIHRECSKS